MNKRLDQWRAGGPKEDWELDRWCMCMRWGKINSGVCEMCLDIAVPAIPITELEQ